LMSMKDSRNGSKRMRGGGGSEKDARRRLFPSLALYCHNQPSRTQTCRTEPHRAKPCS
jgi:hypothetical protein